MGEGVGQLQDTGRPPETIDDANSEAATETSGVESVEVESVLPSEPSPSPKGPMRGFLWTSIFFLTAATSAALGAVFALVTPLPPPLVPYPQQASRLSLPDLWQNGLRYRITRPVNILVMGIDRVPDVPRNSPEVLSGRTDTMLLVRIDPEHKTLNVLSIPRDTQVEIPGFGLMKINQANVIGGPSLAARMVSRDLSDVPIDRYVRVSTEAFREIVDLIGGVEVFVPERMEYVDQTQGLYIDLPQGWQTLNGDQAEQFARFRNDGYGDIGRVQRQQQLIKALRDRVISPAIVPRLPQIIRVVQRYVDTNLSPEEMLALVNYGLDLDQDAFRMVMLPGRFSEPDEFIASYWIVDEAARDRVINEYFEVPKSGLASLEEEETPAPDELHIAIQNASSEPGAAQRVADYLQEQGFYNVYVIENWPDEEPETQIIVQRGDLEGAKTVESILGLGQVVSASTGNLDSDLTIRVGDDWIDPAVPPVEQ